MRFSDGSDLQICGEVLGIGAYAEVRVALLKSTQQLVAAKIFDLKRGLQNSISREIKILSKLKNNKFVIQLLEVVPTCIVPVQNLKPSVMESDASRMMCVLVEELAVTDLFSIILQSGPFPEPLARRLFSQLVSAVDSLHESGVIHLDIKPENILLSPTFELKLCDFGLSVDLHSGTHDTEVLQDGFTELNPYIAPELVHERTIHPSCDIWSCAVVLYIILMGKPPFRRPVLATTSRAKRCKHFVKIIDGKYPTQLSELAQDLMQRILRIDPSDRLTASDILDHPWLQNDVASEFEWRSQMSKRVGLFKSLETFGNSGEGHQEEGEY